MQSSVVNGQVPPVEVSEFLSALQRGYVLPPANTEILFRRKYTEDFGPFQAIERLNTHDDGVPDIFDKLAELPLSAVKAFARIKKSRNWKNGLCIVPTFHSQSQRVTFNRAVQMLVKKDIVKRVPVKNPLMSVKKGTLMINPHIIMPKKYSEAVNYWNHL